MSVLPATSVQNKLGVSSSVIQLGSRPATNPLSPRNATGAYVGTSDPLTAGKVKSTIPPTARGRLAPPHFFRPQNTAVEKKRQEPPLPVAHFDGPKSHPDGVCPKRHQAIASADPIEFQKLTKRNPRQFTKINNNGVKHFELLRQHGIAGDQGGHMVSEATLISELNKNRTTMLGIATCFDQLNVKSFDDVKTLLPKRRSRSSQSHRAESKTPCRQSIGTATLMAHLPHNAQPKLTQYLPSRAPFFKTDSQLSSPRRKDTNNSGGGGNSGADAQQLSSSDLHRAGFLSRASGGASDPRGQPAITDRDVERLFAKSDPDQKKVLRENIEVPCPTAANTRPTTRDDCPHRSPFTPPVARTNSELEAAEEEERDKVSEMSSPLPPRGQGRHAPPRRIQSMSQIDISVHNEDGEADTVEIDIADEEPKEEQKYIPNARRQSISDRISRRRHSELAAEIIRLSAENRRREFAELLNEHKALVLEIESGETVGQEGETGDVEEKCDVEDNKENEQT